MALITFLSLYDFSEQKGIDIPVPFLDKAVHFTFYLIATLLACHFIRERSRGAYAIGATMLVSGAVMLVYSSLLELIQSAYTENRRGEFLDLVANIAGIVVALLVIRRLYSPKSRLKWKY